MINLPKLDKKVHDSYVEQVAPCGGDGDLSRREYGYMPHPEAGRA